MKRSIVSNSLSFKIRVNPAFAIILAFFFSPLAVMAQSTGMDSSPNILFIAVDDLRPELNCYGVSGMITPNIDRLAEQGVTFRRAYCQQSICMASRASIMSGIGPEYRKLYNCSSLQDLAPDLVTLNEHFENNGYSTAGIGKIYHHQADHLEQFGDDWHDPADLWTGTGYVTDEAIEEMKANEKFDSRKNGKGPAYEMADVPDEAYIDGANADYAMQRLMEFKKAGKPFFLAVGFHKPHLPWCAPKKYWDMYPAEKVELSPNPDFPEGLTPYSLTTWGELRSYFGIPQGDSEVPPELTVHLRRAYFASVSYMDAQLGKILEALNNNGFSENTIIILWGDHGWKLGDHNAWSKHTNFEVDTRVPLIISAPGMAEKGKQTDAFAELLDVYPTLCDLAGIEKPSHLQGKSLAPVLSDPASSVKEVAYSIFPRERLDDERTITGFALRNDRYRYMEWIHLASGRVLARELYDHDTDPLETINVAEYQTYAGTVYDLSLILHEKYDDAIPGRREWPDVILYNPADLVYARYLSIQGVEPYAAAVKSLKKMANTAMHTGPFSVMQKKMYPPSGNKHDYYSLATYWWPDPDTPGGLPYVRHDGLPNPELEDYDTPALSKMSEAVFTLSLAWFYTGYDPYAYKARELLKTWFVDPETRMNPHLKYGQAIPGITEGRGFGIIETGQLIKVINGIGLLGQSQVLEENELAGLKKWFDRYTHWLLTSELGMAERMWRNNHGSSYDSQVATFAIFTGEDSVATMILDSVKLKRISRHIEPDGSQPLELRRTKGMSYSIKNLNHLMENAILAERYGIDLWHYESNRGGSILQAVKYLIPFFAGGKEFPYLQIGGIKKQAGNFSKLLFMAANKYKDEELWEALYTIQPEPDPGDVNHLLNPVFEKP